jgi:HAD superfamily hydrolase (TIGR01509 family)
MILQKKNLLFDFDGTLVDSAPLHEEAFRMTLASRRPDLLAVFDYPALKGLTTSESFGRIGIVEGDELDYCVRCKQETYRQFVHQGRLKLFSGVQSLFEAAQGAGCELFLVTSGSVGSVCGALKQLGIGNRFRGVVTAEDVPFGKPSPDPYLLCLKRFALTVAESVAVEDAPSGVVSARAAGLQVIGVNDPGIQPIVDCFFLTMTEFAGALGYLGEKV